MRYIDSKEHLSLYRAPNYLDSIDGKILDRIGELLGIDPSTFPKTVISPKHHDGALATYYPYGHNAVDFFRNEPLIVINANVFNQSQKDYSWHKNTFFNIFVHELSHHIQIQIEKIFMTTGRGYYYWNNVKYDCGDGMDFYEYNNLPWELNANANSKHIVDTLIQEGLIEESIFSGDSDPIIWSDDLIPRRCWRPTTDYGDLIDDITRAR